MPIVEAAFTSAFVHGEPMTAKRLEEAMAKAVQAAHDAGITDPVKIKEAMMAAYKAERAK